jgi:geranylgeranyl pyrophosphate synthase
MRPSLLLAAAHEMAKGEAKEKLAGRWRREAGLTGAEVEALLHEAGAPERCGDLLERYKEEAIRSLRDVEQASLKGLLRRVVGKIFNDTEIKGWCKEVAATNA